MAIRHTTSKRTHAYKHICIFEIPFSLFFRVSNLKIDFFFFMFSLVSIFLRESVINKIQLQNLKGCFAFDRLGRKKMGVVNLNGKIIERENFLQEFPVYCIFICERTHRNGKRRFAARQTENRSKQKSCVFDLTGEKQKEV